MRKKILCVVLLLIMFLSFASPINNANAEGNTNEVDISTSPRKVSFDFVNAVTEFERKIVQNHCVFGCKLLGDFHSLAHVKEAFFKHHQRKDGLGYPNNHPGDPIPELAQILGLVEIYLAMIHPRAYHDPKTREEALAEIQELERKRVDSEILEAFEDAIYHLDMMEM